MVTELIGLDGMNLAAWKKNKLMVIDSLSQWKLFMGLCQTVSFSGDAGLPRGLVCLEVRLGGIKELGIQSCGSGLHRCG